MPTAADELANARQAVTTLLPLAVHASGGMRPGEDRPDYLNRVRQLAVDLWLETSAESETVRRIAELAACRTFTAVLLGVRIEPSTTRAILTLRSWGPDGQRQEEIRTDRTDDPRGVQTLELARSLVGHRVTVYKLEEPGRGRQLRYRCAKHLVDLGPADVDPDAETAPASPPAPAAVGVPIAVARHELLQAIDGDEEYRAAALHGIMRRAEVDGAGSVLNVALLRMLAARTPGPDTAAGQRILAGYRASAPAG